jgi:hypothetical protein
MNSNRQPKVIRVIGAVLIVIALLAFASQSAEAQSREAQKPTPTLQELKEKLLQLEQSMLELKGQINSAEQAEKSAVAPATVTAAVLNGESQQYKVQKASAPPAGGISADVALANSARANAAKTSEAAATTPRKTQSSNAESSLELYGFAMLDMGYQFKQNDPNWFDVIRPVKLPSFKDEFAPDGKWYSSVRQTRFGVKSSTPTALGDLNTQFEFELFGTGVDAGQTTFRLRHAYGELGQIGGGQYWSPFMDIDVFPNSIEYWGPNGMVLFRNVQVRWMPIKGDSRVTIAIERPGASADQGIYEDRVELQGVKPKLDVPDVSWEARLGRRWGYVEIAGIFRRLKWEDTNNDQFDLSGSDLGWGLNLSSNIKFGKRTTGRFQVVYGEGIQNYMNDAPTDVAIKNNFSDPTRPIKGVALPLVGVVAFLDHNWNDRLSTAVGYSMLDIQNSNGQAANAFNQGHYALANLLWSPVQYFMVGGEFQFGRRLNYLDGWNVNDYRLQISFKYNWSKVFKF